MEKQKLSRRHFLGLSAAAASGAMLAACTPAAKPPEPTQAPAGETVAAPTTAPAATPATSGEQSILRVWHWDNFLAEPYTKEGQLWAEQTGRNVKVSVEVFGWNEFSQKILTALAGGTPPEISGTAGEHMTTLSGNGALAPLKPFIDRDGFDMSGFQCHAVKFSSWGGELFSIPCSESCYLWYYNADEFKNQGLKTPTEYWREGKWTWDVATELAEKLTKGSGTDKVWGVMEPGVQEYYKMQPYVCQNGGDFFNKDYTKATIAEDASLETFQWGFDLRPFAPGPEDQKTGTHQSGKIMMWTNWDIYWLMDRPEIPFNFSAAPTPASPKTGKRAFVGDACGWGILKDSKAQDVSWDLTKFLVSRESLVRIFKLAYLPPPTNKDLFDINFWKEVDVPEPEIPMDVHKERANGASENPPKMDSWLEMWTAERQEISLAWADEQPLADALGKVAGRWDEILKEANVDPDNRC